MITLYQFYPCWELPNASPFCMKLETYLRMTKLPYQVKNVMDPRKAPKGKLPFIKDDGVTVSDSSLIIEYLKEKYGDILDVNLTPAQRAVGLAFTRLMEEHLYWCIVTSRWIDDTNWILTRDVFFAKLPGLIRNFVANSVRKSMRKDLYSQGVGRHTLAEIYKMGIADVAALSSLLQENKFLLGNEPTSIDACGYAFIANLIHSPTISTMNDYARSQLNLRDYCARMKALYY